MNKTKIIATIGPATSSKEMLKKIIVAGANVCRINFSHGTHDDHLQVINSVRELNTELGIHTAILADLQGPKLRVGIVAEGSKLVKGKKLVFTTKECEGSSERVFMTYSAFPNDVAKGDKILIDDGKLVLKALSSNKKDEVVAEVLQGGPLSSNKGVNLPNTSISLPCLTKKDLVDLDFALDHKIAWIGLSFVRSARDIIEIKEIIAGSGERSLVVAKIEKPQAVADIDAIIQETDAIMVARGDLGVEVPMHEVPLIQKRIVEKSRKSAKPVIIATQMMETMIDSLTPTRAEVNDVANAVTDGADAVMLSAETSVGKYPVEVIKMMGKIVTNAETHQGIYNKEQKAVSNTKRFITDSICYQACRLAENVSAKGIITNTFSGYTAFKISSYRPNAGIYIFTSNPKILNMLSLIWGVQGFHYDKFVSTDHTIADIKFFLKKGGYLKAGDLAINIASMPITDKGESNMLKLTQV
ncbi:pyruvate kinase [bacterium]|jgi:pyruvate kinase|nr:pyruvate kinase [bacterium]